MAKSSKNVVDLEAAIELLLTNGTTMNKQVVLSMERMLRRSFIAMNKYQGNEELCEDIKSLLEWVAEIMAEDEKRTRKAAVTIEGPMH